jgi:hypothetical protein
MAAVPAPAWADSYRIQSDGLFGLEPDRALLVLQGDTNQHPWISADALVWGGLRPELQEGRRSDLQADVLVMSIDLHDPNDRASLRAGRFIVGPGALRPLHIDGAKGRVRLPGQLRVEAFGGVPVVPRFGERSYDWVVGGRVSRALGDWGSVGVAYAHQRDRGARIDEVVGVDIGLAPFDWLDLAGKLLYDLVDPGIAEVRGAAVAHHDGLQVELFGQERSPSRLLPATSLFSVLGDHRSRLIGTSGRYRAAPRLDLEATAAARWIGDDVAPSLRGRGVLRLDAEGKSAVALEARREASPDADWTGIRATGRVVIVPGLRASTELELVVPDDPQGRGEVWPWGLLALTWEPVRDWSVSAAIQTRATPTYRTRTGAFLRVTHRLEEQ